jgi:hypothetical protein
VKRPRLESGIGEWVGGLVRNGQVSELFDVGIRLTVGRYAIPVVLAFPVEMLAGEEEEEGEVERSEEGL